MTFADLLGLDRAQLSSLLQTGDPVDADSLADTEFRGVSLGLPGWFERLTWKKFKKSFARGENGGVRGWNVRIVQDGLDAPWRPMMRRGRPITFGHFDVETQPRGTLLCYRGALRFVRDPLVALDGGSVLLGCSLIALGRYRVSTPSYFALERDGPLTYRARAKPGA